MDDMELVRQHATMHCEQNGGLQCFGPGSFSHDVGCRSVVEACDRVEEELRQSFYYRECRDKWRETAEQLFAGIMRLKQAIGRTA